MIRTTLPITTAAWEIASAEYRQAVRDMALAVARASLMTPVAVHTTDGTSPVIVRGSMAGDVG